MPEKLGVRLENFEEVAYSVSTPQMPHDGEGYAFDVQTWFNFSDGVKNARIFVMVSVSGDADTPPFLTLKTETHLGLSGINPEPGKHERGLPIPKNLAAHLAGIGLSITRGVLFEKSRAIKDCSTMLLPLINYSELPLEQKEFPKIEGE